MNKRAIKRSGLMLFLLAVLGAAPGLFSAENETANYINSVFYNKRLSMLRNTFEMKHYALIMDFNFYARDQDNDMIMPMMLGVAYKKRNTPVGLGGYFLAYSTNLFNFAPLDTSGGPDPFAETFHWYGTSDEQKKSLRYYAVTGGIIADFQLATLQADVTLSKTTPVFYVKSYIPLLKTYFGGSFDKYREFTVDTLGASGLMQKSKRMEIGKDLALDMLDMKTYSIKYLTLGLRYLNWLNTRYAPNLSTSLSQVFPRKNFPMDLQFFFETRGKKPVDVLGLRDFDTRLVYYTGNPNGIVTWCFGVSYKSPEDGFSQVLTESGGAYNGQQGFGFETGLCLRTPGKADPPMLDKNFLKYVIYYNYSEYFDRYPGNIWGMKFRVLI